ncbi:hypothetical protein [Chromobacterium haemolyticum]|uniref:hypothetical protein n=1 Tax=Chromobacterium TaxID=535 RepID=UPI00405718B6
MTTSKASRILEVVDVDYGYLDLIVTNEDGIAIGRPFAAVAFEKFSRCILGFSIGMGGNKTRTVFKAIRQALFPKTYLESRFPGLGLTWECYGRFEKFSIANGNVLHAEYFLDYLLSIGINAECVAPWESSEFRGVEKFLREFNRSLIQKFPEATVGQVFQSDGLDEEHGACVTLEQLERFAHVWILSIYHRKKQRVLNSSSPIDVWKKSARSFPSSLRNNSDDLSIEPSEVSRSNL